MAKTGFIIEWDTKKVDKMVGKAKDKLKDPQKWGLWKRLVMFLFMSWISETFKKIGARRGHAEWAPLSLKYKEWKTSVHYKRGAKAFRKVGGVIRSYTKKRGKYGPYSSKPLIKFGHLQGSFVLGAKGNVFRQGKTEMFFGSRVPYAEYHQYGGDIEGRPPKREMVFITGLDEDEISKEVGKWMMEGL